MSFCAVQDVTDITGSGLESAIITRLITSADNRIKRVLVREGLGTNPSPVPDNLKEASANFAAAMVLRRHMVDGKLPASQNVSGASASVNVEKVIADCEAAGEEFLRQYLDDNADADTFRAFRIVGRDGERVGEYDTMTKAQQEEV